MIHRLLSRLPLILVLVVLAAGGAWAWRANGTIELAAAPPRRGPAVEAIYATGTVEAEKWARIAPVTPGRISEIFAVEGDAVKAGQPLIRLDDREASARIAELEAKAAYWKEEIARSAPLLAAGYRSKEADQKARSEYNQVVAAINAARQRRTDLIVVSPMDGVVLRRDGEVGELAEVKDALFWVGAPRPLRLTAEVDEEDIARVRVGQKVLIKADAFAERILEAKVDRITPKGDPINKTFRVRVVLPDDTPLLVGMTTEINIITKESPDAQLIPATAPIDGKVFVVENGTAQSRPVTIGIRGRTMVEVLNGLAADQLVITAPPTGLKTGDRVRVK
ncbi:efflux RND transporter periplasmic adaptor subunit [Paramagnetospirillum kuznetsovii]|uniref:Efflux RND transporter periplasmic adaptor subunit n=1 Tax=Paramagnetospirillum kuznetsovii TaxID=2053833 RepID=A0A364NWE2_9PROT|nr:efflux RND transporter periplasmic adaptor subunit [Paramagnetospirillum kuznetsovii]RAU21363.1 efflux RND transporter periplasmic adaptor subunit [Paramagnetospirillum kuznetsovii]